MDGTPWQSGVQDASASPIPKLSVPTPAAPGLKGPKGLAPRDQFSRVNSGVPDPADAGAQGQKSLMPPTPGIKTASEVTMNTAVRPTLQQLFEKAAMDGTTSAASQRVEEEARRQVGSIEGVKQASASVEKVHHARKLASAVEYIAKQASLFSTGVGPGEGPNTLHVSASPGGAVQNTDFGQSHIHQHPEPHLEAARPGDATTQMATTASGGLKARLMGLFGKKTAGAYENGYAEHNLDRYETPEYAAGQRRAGRVALMPTLGLMGAAAGGIAGLEAGGTPEQQLLYGAGGAAIGGLTGLGTGYFAGGAAGDGLANFHRGAAAAIKDRHRAIVLDALKQHAAQSQQAQAAPEAAAQPAMPEEAPKMASAIRAYFNKLAGEGPNTLPQSVAGQAGPPAENKDKVPATYEGVHDLTRREARANRRADMREFLREPMQSSSTDHTLNNILANTAEAGAKIAGIDPGRVAATKALIDKLATEGSR